MPGGKKYRVVVSDELPFIDQIKGLVDIEAFEKVVLLQKKLDVLCGDLARSSFTVSGDLENELFFAFFDDYVLYFGVFEDIIVPLWFYTLDGR